MVSRKDPKRFLVTIIGGPYRGLIGQKAKINGFVSRDAPPETEVSLTHWATGHQLTLRRDEIHFPAPRKRVPGKKIGGGLFIPDPSRKAKARRA